ncbi:TolC family protein [Bdellovibrionota bacterium FG-1]
MNTYIRVEKGNPSVSLGILIYAIASLCAAGSAFALPQSENFELSFRDAESEAIRFSSRLKAAATDEEAALEQAKAGFSTLLPRLTLQAGYQYLGTVPSLAIGAGPPIQLTSHSSYSIGPALSYTFWDNFSALDSYQSLNKLAEARGQDREAVQSQLLYLVRSTYVRVQLALEEFRLVNGSLKLAKAQDHDITTRFHAGAATRLDLVTSNRQILSYELQFKQKQADLSAVLRDLMALVGPGHLTEAFRSSQFYYPGPPDVEHVSLVLKLDTLSTTLAVLGQFESSAPNDLHPQLRGQLLLADATDRAASGQKAKLLPTLGVSASTTLTYPNGPIPEQIHQNAVALSLSMPLYLGDPTWHLASEKRKEADGTRFRADQLRVDLLRDYEKSLEMLSSLREQQKLAAQDVLQSEESAKLYYGSYKAGKNNLIDVQTANNAALQAKVGAAHIDAQILNQIITLIALSGKEGIHD